MVCELPSIGNPFALGVGVARGNGCVCDDVGELGAVGTVGKGDGSVRARFVGEGPSVESCVTADGGRDLSVICISGDAANGGGGGLELLMLTSLSVSDRVLLRGCIGGGVGDTAEREL